MAVDEEAVAVVDALEGLGIDYALTGSFASNFHGVSVAALPATRRVIVASRCPAGGGGRCAAVAALGLQLQLLASGAHPARP